MSAGGKEKKLLPETERNSWLYQLHVICMLKGSSLVAKEMKLLGFLMSFFKRRQCKQERDALTSESDFKNSFIS